MNKLLLAATKNTPEVLFDVEAHEFKIEGVSTPVNAFEFYQNIVGWLNENDTLLPNEAIFKFNMPYFNSATMKALLVLFERIKARNENGGNWIIDWFVEDEDEFMLDAAESFQSILEMDFRISG